MNLIAFAIVATRETRAGRPCYNRATTLSRSFGGALIGLLIGAAACLAGPPSTSTQPAADDHFDIGDRLRISVADLLTPGQTTTITPLVDDDDKIGLLLIKPVVATDLTADQLADNIAQAYSDAHLISNADVKVERIENPAAGMRPRSHLRNGDSIQVRIWDLEGMKSETKMEKSLDGSGEVTLLKLAKPIALSGLSERDAAVKIARQYTAENVLLNASVEVIRASR